MESCSTNGEHNVPNPSILVRDIEDLISKYHHFNVTNAY